MKRFTPLIEFCFIKILLEIWSLYKILPYGTHRINQIISQNNLKVTEQSIPDTVQEVAEFLETFFTFYPTATEKELAYYVKNNALVPIVEDYKFSGLINQEFQIDEHQIKVWVTVRYLDETTKAIQFSQYELQLEKDSNWMIVASE